MKSLVVLPGVVDLLPDHALDARWWQRYSGDAPSASALSEARRRRSDLKLATNDSALTIVFGAADDTPTVDLNADDDVVTGVSREGDGWMINPVESVPAGQRWFVRATHESLLSEATTARVAADLVQRDQTSAGTREAPDLRAPRNEIEPLRFPSQDDLTAVLLFGGEPPPVATRELRVRVAHGSLDRLGWPVAVGHYNADAIYGAEKFLDRCLGGCLSRRLEVGLGLYPGRAGTALHVPAPDRLPRGALVVGLGDVGELTADTLTRGIAAATVQFALHQLDTRAAPRRADASEPQPLPLTLASLLIGTRGGRQLSVRRSVGPPSPMASSRPTACLRNAFPTACSSPNCGSWSCGPTSRSRPDERSRR